MATIVFGDSVQYVLTILFPSKWFLPW